MTHDQAGSQPGHDGDAAQVGDRRPLALARARVIENPIAQGQVAQRPGRAESHRDRDQRDQVLVHERTATWANAIILSSVRSSEVSHLKSIAWASRLVLAARRSRSSKPSP